MVIIDKKYWNKKNTDNNKLTGEIILHFIERLRSLAERIRLDPLSLRYKVSTAQSHIYTINGVNQDYSRVRYYIKLLRDIPERQKYEISPLENEFRALQLLYYKFKSLTGKFSVPKPIIYFSDYQCLITQEVSGYNMESLLKKYLIRYRQIKEINYLKSLCETYVEWLNIFHNFTVKDKTEQFDVEVLRQSYSEQLRTCCDSKIINLRKKEKLEESFDKQRSCLRNVVFNRVCVHGDSKPANILVDGINFAVIDFSAFKYGDPYEDFCSFWFTLGRLAKNPIYERNIINALQAYLLNCFLEKTKLNYNTLLFFQLFHAVRISAILGWQMLMCKQSILNTIRNQYMLWYYRTILENLS